MTQPSILSSYCTYFVNLHRGRTATQSKLRMIVLNLVLRISDTIKKHLSPSIDERAVNVWYNLIILSSNRLGLVHDSLPYCVM